MSRFILDVHETFGITMLLIEHDMAVVMSIAEQVVVLDFGLQDRRGHAGRGAARRGRDRGVPRAGSGGRVSDATIASGAARGAGRGPPVARRVPAEAPRDLARGHLGRVRGDRCAASRSRSTSSASAPAIASPSSPTTSRDGSTPISAIQAVGAASGRRLRRRSEPAEAAAAIAGSGARIVFCGDQEQVDKLLEREEDLRRRRERWSSSTSRACTRRSTRTLPLQPFADVRRAWARALTERASRFGELLAARRPDDVATIGAHLGHDRAAARLVELGQAGEVHLARLVAASSASAERDCGYSLLPLAHATSRTLRCVRAARRRVVAQLRRVARHGAARPGRGVAHRARRDAAAARADARATSSSGRGTPAGSSGASRDGAWRAARDRRPARRGAGLSGAVLAGRLVAGSVSGKAGLARVRSPASAARSWLRTRCGGSGRSASRSASSTARSRPAASSRRSATSAISARRAAPR